jgi:4'-phosphopantetheinyl transferase EntD
MTSDCAERLDDLCSQQLPTIPGLLVRCAAITDRGADLSSEELEAISKAVSKRRNEFATGRWLARRTMLELGLEPGHIARGDQRQPIWPAGITGSITHADDIAAVAVSAADACQSIGIDLERWQRVTPELHRKLFTDSELTVLSALPEAAAGLVFSAKEAGYKATFPLAGRFISFHEAEIDVDWPARRFAIRYVGEHSQNAVMEQGEGYFIIAGDYALSLFVIR